MVDFAFVSVGTGGVTRTADKNTVRSHCMKGVNKRDDSRRSRRARRRRAVESDSDLQVTQRESRRTPESLSLAQQAIMSMIVSERLLGPKNFLTNITLIPMACCNNANSRELLSKYGLFKQKIYPLDHCIDFETMDEDWAGWFGYDEAFVHATLFTSAAIEDFVLHRAFSKTTRLHLRQTLTRLKEILAEGKGQFTDATVFIVLSLCFIASIYGDGDSLRVHLSGLREMIQLRGRENGLFLHPKMRFKIDRLDLAGYICNGSAPLFIEGPVSWKGVFDRDEIGQTMGYWHVVGHSRDARVVNIFRDMRCLAADVDRCYASNGRLRGPTFRATTYSIQSRLLSLEDGMADPLADCLRLGMLALLSTHFRVPDRHVSGRHLREAIQKRCDSVEQTTQGMREVVVWLLMMAAVSVFEPDESWIRGKWEDVAGPWATFDEVRKVTRGLVWIECMHDELGARALDALRGKRTEGTEATHSTAREHLKDVLPAISGVVVQQ